MAHTVAASLSVCSSVTLRSSSVWCIVRSTRSAYCVIRWSCWPYLRAVSTNEADCYCPGLPIDISNGLRNFFVCVSDREFALDWHTKSMLIYAMYKISKIKCRDIG